MGKVYRDDAQGVTLLSLKFFQDHKMDIGHIKQVRASFRPLHIRRTGKYRTVIRDVDGNEIWLSGCGAGYRGTGPQGTAFLLRQIDYPIRPKLFTEKRKPVVIRPITRLRQRNQRSSWLRQELTELQELFQWGREFRAEWHSRVNGPLEGEVAGDRIRVYSRTRPDAIRTLRHEFLDKLVSTAIEPYARIADLVRILSWLRTQDHGRAGRKWEEALNLILTESENEAYNKKEMVVEKLSAVFDKIRQNESSTQPDRLPRL